MTPPDDFSFKLLDWAWGGILALGGLVWKSQNEKISASDKEITRQRDNIASLFDKLEAHARRSEDRHVELMHALHSGLSGKADKK
jgi:hypothetical protein